MESKSSRFAACHPAVSFTFFAFAILGSVFFQHPAYLAASIFAAVCLLLTEQGRKALPWILGMLPVFVVLSAINPLFNTDGETVLFSLLGRPYTLEALLYGMAVSGMLVAALLWFRCYNAVMTSDKFTCLFGSLIPALSLILVMILRLIPAYQRKAAQIAGARRCVGKSAAGNWLQKVQGGITIVSVMTSWALEGAIITADSMRSRGYGAAKRSSFSLYRWRTADLIILCATILLFSATIAGSALGWTQAAYTPVLKIAPVAGHAIAGLTAYGGFLLLPSLMNFTEALKWSYFRSKI